MVYNAGILRRPLVSLQGLQGSGALVATCEAEERSGGERVAIDLRPALKAGKPVPGPNLDRGSSDSPAVPGRYLTCG